MMNKIIYKQNKILRSIIQKSFQLKELNLKVKALLSSPLSEHCNVANLEDGCLHVQADSAAWSTYLIYQKEELLQKLQAQHYKHIVRIKCSVTLAPPFEKPLVPKETPKISATTIELLNQTADIVSDPKLKAALTKLALRLGLN